METISTYLKQLKFDPRLTGSLIARYITNFRLVTLFLLAIIIFGIQSYFSLPRKLNPDIKIPIVLVSTVLPGANPTDIESLITVPIEDSVRGVSDISTVTSSSTDSVSVISVQFKTGADPDKAKNDVQSAVDKVTGLPADAQKTSVQKLDFENQPIWQFNLSGEGDRASLIRFSRTLKKDLEDLTSIDKVTVNGSDEQEIQVVVKPEAVSNYKINPQLLSGSIKTALGSFPAGSVKTENGIFSLTIDPAVVSVDDFRNIQVNVGAGVVPLSQIATVAEVSKPDQAKSFIYTPGGNVNSSISFDIFRVNTVNIDQADKEAQDLVNKELKDSGNRFKISTIQNAQSDINTQFSDLQRDITTTILLVFVVLFTFLGIRQAIISMLSIPLTFLITFIAMRLTGIALSFIATFSLLLSLGLLVDDAIVIISAMTSYFRSRKFTPLETGLLVWKDFWVAILTTTITTVWAFIPLLLSSGIIGEFIKPIPIVVSATLLGSIIVALFLTLPMMVFLLRPQLPKRVKVLLLLLLIGVLLGLVYVLLPKTVLLGVEVFVAGLVLLIIYIARRPLSDFSQAKLNWQKFIRSGSQVSHIFNDGIVSFQGLDLAYSRLIHRILSSAKSRRNTIIMVIIFSLFSYILLPAGFVKYEFFPKTDENNLFVNVELPAGTNSNVAGQESLKFFDYLKDAPFVEFITLNQGQTAGNQDIGGGGGGSQPNVFSYSIRLKDKAARNQTSTEISQILRNKLAFYNTGKVSVVEVSGGPPAGADLQIKLFGPDLKTLDTLANQVQDYLKKQPGVTNIDKTVKSGTGKLVFVPDKQKIVQNGLTTDQVGFWLRLYASGFKADDYKFPGDEKLTEDVTVRLGSGTEDVENLTSIDIPTQTGSLVPLTNLGSFELETNPTLITREDGKRTISVTAGVTKGYNVADLNTHLVNYAKSINYPAGYGWATGGANEENDKSVASILQAMILSFVLIITTMVLQFSSFRKALIVMLVIPLSISGVFIIFALTRTPLSFPALIGVLALFGIVVKNSILVVDKIEINRKTGMEFTESIADAAASRLEPIALTSVCAIVGLLPITLSDPLWTGLGGAIIAGLTFSGTIMLFFIPVVYYMIYNPYRKVTSNK